MSEKIEVMDVDFATLAKEMEDNLGYTEEFEQHKREEAQREQNIVIRKNPRKTEELKKSYNFQNYPEYYNDENDVDKNVFSWEGTVENLYTPPNNALTYVGIKIVNQDNEILSIPQAKVFKDHANILQNIKKGDYVRAWGYIDAQTKVDPNGKSYKEANYIIYKIKSFRKVSKDAESFTQRFGIDNDRNSYGRELNEAVISGIVSDIRIIGHHTRKCRFVVNSYWKRYSEDSIVCLFDLDNNPYAKSLMDNLRENTRVYVTGKTVTARKRLADGKDKYVQDFVTTSIHQLKTQG